jgi:hypothetical protein
MAKDDIEELIVDVEECTFDLLGFCKRWALLPSHTARAFFVLETSSLATIRSKSLFICRATLAHTATFITPSSHVPCSFLIGVL